jgi:hypothetical protein
LFIKDNEAEWGNAKHRYEWEATLRRYVYPVLGWLPIEVIDTPLVLRVIKPLWERIPATASRVLGRIHAVIGWATVHHYRSGDNPARWQGHLEHALPSRRRSNADDAHAVWGTYGRPNREVGQSGEVRRYHASVRPSTTATRSSTIDYRKRAWDRA